MMNKKELQVWFEDFLKLLLIGGWKSTFSRHGWNLSPDHALSSLLIDRKQKGFEDFAHEGTCAIEPGDPSLSLLYHALMSQGVYSEEITTWPTLEQIDTLENYIYSLKPLDKASAEMLVPAVLAYEYRPASGVPHHKHADFVYSRTGVGRVGTHEPYYDPKKRSFVTVVEDGSGGTRVQSVRYGLFLCIREKLNEGISLQGARHSGDDERRFLQPVHKLFSGNGCIEGCNIQVAFTELHQNDKLKRMIEFGKLKIGRSFDLNSPPFKYQSNRDDFVQKHAFHGSVVISRQPCDFVKIAKQDDRIATFEVPKEKNLWLKKYLPYGSRRYTSLRVGQSLFWAGLDLGLNLLLKKWGTDKRVFLSPRPAGEFTNIRHVLDSDGEVIDLNLMPEKKFEDKLSRGGYRAVLFEDGISEGAVDADVQGLRLAHKVRLAYSLMTAPDFMPRVGNIDIYQHEKNFDAGGPRALCEGRLVPNLRLLKPNTDEKAFTPKDETALAVVALGRPDAKAVSVQPQYTGTRYLSDEASDVFAPGWDITYNRDSFFSTPYYHVSGLGAPFLEDVKLCAAANGMWPAASPDAARTFKRKTRTAIPLTDEEIGLSPSCPLAEQTGSSHRGWDGEYGPYFANYDGKLVVNYACIERSDYIKNGSDGLMSFAQLRLLDKEEINQRMTALATVNQRLLNGKSIEESPFWLVSFQKYDTWKELRSRINLPQGLADLERIIQTFDAEPLAGYFFAFVTYKADEVSSDDVKRKIQVIEKLVLAKATIDGNVELMRPMLAFSKDQDNILANSKTESLPSSQAAKGSALEKES